MKRFLRMTSVIILILAGVSVDAKIRTSAEVLSIAQQHFTTQRVATRTFSSVVVKTILASEIFPRAQSRSSSGGEPFYVLVASDGSNVIVSGDDRMIPVLGYSDGAFDKNQLNIAFKDLLSVYCSIYDDIQLKGGTMPQVPTSYLTQTLPASVPSLLGGTKWNQLAPYNNMCPVLDNGKNAYTGCVATAMVMHYHQHPARATGRGLGQYNDIALDSSPFEWDKMLKEYKGTTDPAENQAAVAWLMRAVAASINTRYDYSGAGSSDFRVVWALSENFGYDKGVFTISRREKTLQQWIELLKKELAEGRPVVYSGLKLGSAEGHCFVIDGYSSDGLFNVNWGWGGVNNGSFAITGLDGYVRGESAIIGFQKPTGLPYVSNFGRTSSELSISPTTVNRNESFSLASGSNYVNRGDTFTGEIALVLFQGGQSVTTAGTSLKVSNIKRNDGVTVEFKNVVIPANVPDGRYQLYVASKANVEHEWQPVSMYLESLPYYNVDINDSQIVFTSPVVATKYKVLSITPNTEKIHLEDHVTFNVKVQNDGTEIVRYIDIGITALATGKLEIFNEMQRCVLSPGENEFSFSKSIFFEPGEYKIELLQEVSVGLGVEYQAVDGSNSLRNIEILEENFEKYDYYVIASSIVPQLNVVANKDSKPCVVLELTNKGAKDMKDGYFQLTTYQNKVPVQIPRQLYVSIKKGETQNVVLESLSGLSDGDYTFSFVFQYPSQPRYPPTLVKGDYQFGIRAL